MTKYRLIRTIYSITLSIIFISCSQQTKNKNDITKDISLPGEQDIQKENSIDSDCLTPSDSNEVVKYFKVFQTYLDNKDTTGLTSLISFPMYVDGDSIKQDAFILSYYNTVTTYLLRSTIKSSELNLLKRYEGFVKAKGIKGCYRYKISNSFPELEFNVNFIIDKKGGSLKLTSLQVSG